MGIFLVIFLAGIFLFFNGITVASIEKKEQKRKVQEQKEKKIKKAKEKERKRQLEIQSKKIKESRKKTEESINGIISEYNQLIDTKHSLTLTLSKLESKTLSVFSSIDLTAMMSPKFYLEEKPKKYMSHDKIIEGLQRNQLILQYASLKQSVEELSLKVKRTEEKHEDLSKKNKLSIQEKEELISQIESLKITHKNLKAESKKSKNLNTSTHFSEDQIFEKINLFQLTDIYIIEPLGGFKSLKEETVNGEKLDLQTKELKKLKEQYTKAINHINSYLKK